MHTVYEQEKQEALMQSRLPEQREAASGERDASCMYARHKATSVFVQLWTH